MKARQVALVAALLVLGWLGLSRFGPDAEMGTGALTPNELDGALGERADVIPVLETPSSRDGRLAVEETPAIDGSGESAELPVVEPDSSSVLDSIRALSASFTPNSDRPPTSEELEAKYAEATVGDLQVAHAALKQIVTGRAEEIRIEMTDAGELDAIVLAPGQDAPPIASSSGGAGETGSFVFSLEDYGDGGSIMRSAMIDPERYPAYTSLSTEYVWLASKLVSAGVIGD